MSSDAKISTHSDFTLKDFGKETSERKHSEKNRKKKKKCTFLMDVSFYMYEIKIFSLQERKWPKLYPQPNTHLSDSDWMEMFVVQT